jgi:hypothetical protein
MTATVEHVTKHMSLSGALLAFSAGAFLGVGKIFSLRVVGVCAQ